MAEIHAHEVLRMMEGNSYTKESLKQAIVETFGAEQCFYTCSADGLDIDNLILFLEAKGKFTQTDDGFTMDINKVCSSY
ncbi:MAG: YecH family metal-binding protein [Bacteroidales bacterium]